MKETAIRLGLYSTEEEAIIVERFLRLIGQKAYRVKKAVYIDE